MKASHLALLPLLVGVALSVPADCAAGATSDRATEKRLAAVAAKVSALEALQAERVFWIDLFDAIEQAKSNRVWFAAVYVKDSKSAKALALPSRTVGRPHQPWGAVDERLLVTRAPRIAPDRTNDSTDGSGETVLGLVGLLRAPRGTPDPERDSAAAVETVRRALDEYVPYMANVVVVESELLEPGLRLGPSLVRFVLEAKLVRPERPKEGDTRATGIEPTETTLRVAEPEAELAELLEELRAQEARAIESVSDKPVAFLTDLLLLQSELRSLAWIHRVGFDGEIVALDMRGNIVRPDLDVLRTDPPPEHVPLDLRREILALREMLVLLADSYVDRIDWVVRLDKDEEDAGDPRMRFRARFSGEWPALARFLSGLVRQTPMRLQGDGEFPRGFLVVEDMAFVVVPEAEQDARNAAEGRDRPRLDIIGRMPKHNRLRVALTVALVSPTDGVAERVAAVGEDRAAAAPDDQVLDPVALVERIRDLRRLLGDTRAPEYFEWADIATDPREHKPQHGEKQCPKCGCIVPQRLCDCPNCCFSRPHDGDRDGLADDWEDRHDGTDSTKADADADPDGDGFTNFQEYVGGTDPDDPKSIPSPLRATAVYKAPVHLRFSGYAVEEGGDADKIDPAFWMVQLIYGDAPAQFVRLGGTWRGYKLVSLEKHVRPVQPPGGGRPVQGEVYELTLQRPGAEPITLEKGTPLRITDVLVDLHVVAGNDAGKDLKGLSLGSRFRASGRVFHITTIVDGAIGVEDADGAAFVLRAPSPPEPAEAPLDNDGDGISDDWEEVFEGADSTKPDADADPDGDGFTNDQEYVGGSDPDDPKSLPSPLRLSESYSRPVDILLKGYAIGAGGRQDVIDPRFWIMSMNYGRDSMTGFVRLGGTWHGFKLGPLTRSKQEQMIGAGPGRMIVDVYTLTLQRPGQEPVKIVKGTWAKIDETYIDLRVVSGREAGRLFAGRAVGDTITTNGMQYTIAEVGDAASLIRDAEGTEYLLPLRR